MSSRGLFKLETSAAATYAAATLISEINTAHDINIYMLVTQPQSGRLLLHGEAFMKMNKMTCDSLIT
jgi:hypothetical protein